MKIRRHEYHEQLTLQMTPMIDVVFQLMVFFVFTFKISRTEGDISVRLPTAKASASAATSSDTPLIKIRLRANESRELAAIELGEVAITGAGAFQELQTRLRALVDDSAGPGASEPEVEIQADYGLRYQQVMNAMTAITAYKDPATGQTQKLIKKVRFAPQARE